MNQTDPKKRLLGVRIIFLLKNILSLAPSRSEGLPKAIFLGLLVLFLLSFNLVSASVFSGSLDFDLPNTLSGEVIEEQANVNGQTFSLPSPTPSPTFTPQPTSISISELNGKILNFSVVQPTPVPSPKVAFNFSSSKKINSPVVSAVQTENQTNQNQEAEIMPPSFLESTMFNYLKDFGFGLLLACSSFLVYYLFRISRNPKQ